jgi:hypothetical protein
MDNRTGRSRRHSFDMSSASPRSSRANELRADSSRADEACLRDSAFLADRGIFEVPAIFRPDTVPVRRDSAFRQETEAA